jgi:hypothetical protein
VKRSLFQPPAGRPVNSGYPFAIPNSNTINKNNKFELSINQDHNSTAEKYAKYARK